MKIYATVREQDTERNLKKKNTTNWRFSMAYSSWPKSSSCARESGTRAHLSSWPFCTAPCTVHTNCFLPVIPVDDGTLLTLPAVLLVGR